MDYDVLEQVAERLDGTDDSLQDLLTEMDISTSTSDVEAELEQKLSFGYCQACESWRDGFSSGKCDLCR